MNVSKTDDNAQLNIMQENFQLKSDLVLVDDTAFAYLQILNCTI